jgi:hypothetical protein
VRANEWLHIVLSRRQQSPPSPFDVSLLLRFEYAAYAFPSFFLPSTVGLQVTKLYPATPAVSHGHRCVDISPPSHCIEMHRLCDIRVVLWTEQQTSTT